MDNAGPHAAPLAGASSFNVTHGMCVLWERGCGRKPVSEVSASFSQLF